MGRSINFHANNGVRFSLAQLDENWLGFCCPQYCTTVNNHVSTNLSKCDMRINEYKVNSILKSDVS